MIMAIPFVGGLALFLLSLVGMSKALGKIIGARTRAALHGASVPAAFASGVGVTALLQSSTLVSVTLVGLVNSGAMGLAPAFAAILGANVGTTVTAQIAGLRPTLLGWVAAGVGLALAGWGWLDIRLPRAAGGPRLERGRTRMLGGAAAMGFSGVVLGLGLVADACGAAVDSETLKIILTWASHKPVLAAVVGAAATAAVQSSSVVSALLVTLTREGLVELKGAIALVIGSNVGTCFTALVAALPTDRDSQTLAWANLIFNVMGAAAFLPFVELFCDLLRLTATDPGAQLANAHALFNIITAAIALPFARQFVELIGGRGKERIYIDRHTRVVARNSPRSY
jgi:phosphate:Na+ symporter